VFKNAPGKGLATYSDLDWASNPITRWSVTGYFFQLAGGPIVWRSRAQTTVAHSSTEAEYMALSDCSRQVSWIRTIFLELGICLGPVLIYADNQGSIFIGSNPVQEICTKHIDVKYHYVHEYIVDKKIVLYHIPIEDNTADIFTKNLGHLKFKKFKKQPGIEFLP
jgi:hypothetical protein